MDLSGQRGMLKISWEEIGEKKEYAEHILYEIAKNWIEKWKKF